MQLYDICSYMGSVTISLFVYNPIYSLSNLSFSKVHRNLKVRVYGSCGCLLLLLISISSSQCLTSAYAAWCWFGDTTISWPFDTQQITMMNAVFLNTGRYLFAFLLVHSPKSVNDRFYPRLHIFPRLSNFACTCLPKHPYHCGRICSALSTFSTVNQIWIVSKKSATAVAQCRGPSQSCVNRFCPRIMDRCFF